MAMKQSTSLQSKFDTSRLEFFFWLALGFILLVFIPAQNYLIAPSSAWAKRSWGVTQILFFFTPSPASF